MFLFALSQSAEINIPTTLAGFIILHFILFPSTNGYNSYQDKDTGSIGALKHPPEVNSNLYRVTLLMDITALIAGLFISLTFSLALLVFVIMSRLYSFRGVRIKKYPYLSFIVVFIFQGGFVYLMSLEAMNPGHFFEFFTPGHIVCMIISSLFIGSMYPLTQIYQHKADKDDGVISISYKLGYTGTFVFSAILFGVAVSLFSGYMLISSHYRQMALFFLLILPVVIRLAWWFNQVRSDTRKANYENTMAVNILSSACMNLYFLIIVIGNQIML